MVRRRSKTDKLNAQVLANLLRINQIPLAYVAPDEVQLLRDVTRHRARLVRGLSSVKISLRALLARHNVPPPHLYPFGPRGLYWFSKQDLERPTTPCGELLGQLYHYQSEITATDQRLGELRAEYPQVEPLVELYGIGLYSALLIWVSWGA
jgi:hypothetical protein